MTKDDIIRMAREAGFADDKGVVQPAYQLEAFATLVAASEREACAKIAEMAEPYKCADLIRARENI